MSKLKNNSTDRVTVENVNVPGYQSTVDGAKYRAMHAALWRALPTAEPGLSQNEMGEAILPFLPDDLFPGGAKARWWMKTVQLDLEAKKKVFRTNTKPLRWYRSK
ncbi:MAG: hypothetical protein K0U93_21665 [Gammaproteobacteria bacterium]|nr:hypothetical protein [Gammaproteobacteria bacterium]